MRQSVKALREDARVEGIAEQLASLVDAFGMKRFKATLETTGTPRAVAAAAALALHRTALEALTNVRRHAAAIARRVPPRVRCAGPRHAPGAG